MRYLSFNSHSLITANVPYEKVLRNSDLDNFACHRRSVWGWAEFAQSEKWLHVCPCSVPVTPASRGIGHCPGFVEIWSPCRVSVCSSAAAPGVGGSRDTLSVNRQTARRSLQMLLHRHCLWGLHI